VNPDDQDTQALAVIAAPAPAPEAEPQADAPEPEVRACTHCGAALADGQDWCLECGTAVKQGRSPLPGWRTGAATIIATVVLASGAVAAAYAAINADDTPSADVGTLIAQNPTGDAAAATDPVAQPDPIDIPSEQEVPPLAGAATPAPDASTATPPAVAPPVATPPVDSTPITPAPTYVPPASTPPPAQTPQTPTDNGGTGNTNSGGNSGSNTGNDAKPVKRAPLEQVDLVPGTTVVTAYNPPAPTTAPTTPADPTQTTPTTTPTTTTPPATTTPTDPNAAPTAAKVHPDTDFSGDPSAAFDLDPNTAWSVALTTPELIADPQVGLLIDLGSATKLRQLILTPTTPGTTIEVYGTDATVAPATLADKSWKKLATQLDVKGKTKITLGKDAVGTGKVRQLLIYFAAGPDDGTSTSVGISELQLYR
jgi:hypothetical protein